MWLLLLFLNNIDLVKCQLMIFPIPWLSHTLGDISQGHKVVDSYVRFVYFCGSVNQSSTLQTLMQTNILSLIIAHVW